MARSLINFAIARSSSSRIVWSSHIKHDIIEVFKVVLGCRICRFISSSIVIIWTEFWVFSVDINKLIVLKRHVLFDEIIDTLTKANLIVKTWWSHKGCWSTVHFWKLDWAFLLVSSHTLIEFFDFDLLNISITSILENDKLMSNDSVCNLLFFFSV